MGIWWAVGWLVLVVLLACADEARFRLKVERRFGSLIWAISIVVAAWFGYNAGMHHAWGV